MRACEYKDANHREAMMTEQEKDFKTHMRQVRSFVRREGRLSSRQTKALDQLWPEYGVEYQEEYLNLERLFGNACPVTLEIGFGMGSSLIETVAAQQETNFIGIEVHRPGIGTCLNRAAANNLTNIKVLKHDAVEVLKNMIPENSLDKIQIFFPDPWPKKKHHKRRIIQLDFVEMITQKLKPSGVLHLATDWENYAEHMLEVLEKVQGLANKAGKNQYSPRPEDRPLTKYEQRGQRLGHGVWDLVFVKQ